MARDDSGSDTHPPSSTEHCRSRVAKVLLVLGAVHLQENRLGVFEFAGLANVANE